MPDSPETVLDYDALLQNAVATLSSSGAQRISPSRIKEIPNTTVVVGGFGDVRMAKLVASWWSAGPGVNVAIKTLRPAGDRSQRIRLFAALTREIHVWSQLNHRNILNLLGYYYDESQLTVAWMATPWQPNGHILAYIQTHDPDPSHRLKLALDTARGLAYLHARSPPVSHGDIKPENTLVDNGGNALICDFGLARLIEGIPSGLTTSRTTSYTPRYAAPELFEKENASHTLQSDVWGWGCLVLVIMTGMLPYCAHTTPAMLSRARYLECLPADLSTIIASDFVKALLEASWKHDPDSRRPMEWFREALTFKTTSLLKDFRQYTADLVPMGCAQTGVGWQVFHNPDVCQPFTIEFPPSLEGIDAWPCKFSPDGRYIAVHQCAGAILLHDVQTNTPRSLGLPSQGPTLVSENVSRICFGSESRLIAVGRHNGSIEIWNLESLTLEHEFLGQVDPVSSLTFAASDTILVSAASADGDLWSWCLKSGTALHALPLGPVWEVAGSPHHPLVVATSLSESWVCNAMSGECWCLISGNGCYRLLPEGNKLPDSSIQKGLQAVVFMPSGRLFITGGGEHEGLRICDIGALADRCDSRGDPPNAPVGDAGMVWRDVNGPQSFITSLAITPDGNLVASGSSSTDSLVLWDLQNYEPIVFISGDKLYKICDVAFRPGSNVSEGSLAFSFYDKALSSYGRRTGTHM